VLVAARAHDPDDHVISAVRGGDERRGASVRGRTPYREDDGRWIGCSNAESRECAAATAKSNIRAQISPIRGCCTEDTIIVRAGNMSRSHRRMNPAEVIAINQIRIAIFTHRYHEAGRCRAWYVHKQRTGAA
jgi:hypothetical protein